MNHVFRALQIIAVSIVTLWLTPSTAFAREQPKHGLPITVMSYNIHWGVGQGDKYNLEKIAADIAKVNADIVGLQEVDANWGSRSEYDHQARKLAHRLNMHYFYAPIYIMDPEKPNLPQRQHGVAVLSRFPIIAASNHQVTRLSTIHPNPVPQTYPGFADVLLRVQGSELRVYDTHLDYREDATIRKQQIREMLDIIGRHSQPQVLLGDLNAPPVAPELIPLFKRFHNALAACAGLCHSFPADKPAVLIDYVLVTPDIRVQSAGILATTASDHRPVFARLVLQDNVSSRTPLRKTTRFQDVSGA